MSELALIPISSTLVNNFALAQFLGRCPTSERSYMSKSA